MVSDRQKELEREGWERKTVTGEPRLGELKAIYESLGFEVLLEPFEPGDDECSACMAADPDRFKTIYVRRRSKDRNRPRRGPGFRTNPPL